MTYKRQTRKQREAAHERVLRMLRSREDCIWLIKRNGFHFAASVYGNGIAYKAMRAMQGRGDAA